MTTTAKFPSATLADFGADTVNIKTAVLSGAHTSGVTTITLTATVPTEWPTAGWVVIDGEIIQYTGKSGATLTGCTRGAQTTYGGGAAASHNDQSIVGAYLTAQQVNQIVAEIIAMQTSFTPNLVLNSDFARRTTFGLAMPEVFADTSGETLITGTLGTVAANVLTAGNTGAWRASVGPTDTTFWRDGRMSATFKLVENNTNLIGIAKYSDANNYVQVHLIGTAINVLQLRKVIAGASTNVNVATGALTLNRWYWIELEAQGTTYTAKLYDTGGTVPGVTKESSTLVVTNTVVIADASVVAGKMTLYSDLGVASQWGGIATVKGGVYVETWLPESWTITHTGTLGGQAIAYDEAADSGPLNRQATPVVYIPAVSRTMTVQYSGPDGQILSSTGYAYSYYEKNTGLGGSGVMIRGSVLEQNSASATQATNSQDDAAETSYTRKSGTFTSNAATRRFAFQFLINQGGARTGTVRFSLPQVEQGAGATPWRNATFDEAYVAVILRKTATTTTASAALVEVDSRDLAANVFLPRDATVRVTARINWQNSGAATAKAAIYVDGAIMGGTTLHASDTHGTVSHDTVVSAEQGLTAGKHRFALVWATTAGTQTLNVTPDAIMEIAWSAGK